MIEIIGEIKGVKEEELRELEHLPEWKERMLRTFLASHYEEDK